MTSAVISPALISVCNPPPIFFFCNPPLDMSGVLEESHIKITVFNYYLYHKLYGFSEIQKKSKCSNRPENYSIRGNMA